MLKTKRYIIAALLLRLILVTPQWALGQTGTLEGDVKDSSGNLVQGADVILGPSEAQEYRAKRVTSDLLGHFTFTNIAAGDYIIYAKKQHDGYPDVLFAFFGIGQPRPLQVKITEAVTTIEVKVGQSDGTLSAIVEDESGKPIPGAQYRLFSADNPDLLIISGADRQGQIETLVPGVPVILQMEAAGFQKWRSNPILITAGQVKQLNIRLTSVAKHP